MRPALVFSTNAKTKAGPSQIGLVPAGLDGPVSGRMRRLLSTFSTVAPSLQKHLGVLNFANTTGISRHRRTAARATRDATDQPTADLRLQSTLPAGGKGDAFGNTATASSLSKQERLEREVRRHDDLYARGQPEITDAEYDSLKRQLRQEAARATGVAPEEVAVPVGAPPAPGSGLRKVSHTLPMLSLAAIHSREETAAWLAKTLAKLPGAAQHQTQPQAPPRQRRQRQAQAAQPPLPPPSPTTKTPSPGAPPGPPADRWVVEPKVDGLAVRATFRRQADGTYGLQEAATRGDGSVGEDVTHNAVHGGIAGLPLRFSLAPRGATGAAAAAAAPAAAPAAAASAAGSGAAEGSVQPEWVEVRGEVFMRLDDLRQLNSEYQAKGQATLANTRNAAAGALRLLDPTECRRRRLSFVAYAALAPSVAAAAAGGRPGAGSAGPLHSSHWETLQWLQAAGFAVSPDNQLALSSGEALERAEKWMAGRAQLGYDADGVVIKLDDTTQYDTLGVAGGSDPRWAVAWKFPAGEAVTELEGIELNVGRLGQITPVALLRGVVIGGATIRRASLHNVGYVTALGLHVGDTVALRRCGDVIPQVIRALPQLRPAGAVPWRPPTTCPCCGGAVRLEPPAARSRVVGTGAGAGDQLVCTNPDCEAKSSKRLVHYAAVCLPNARASAKTVMLLAEEGLVAGLQDFYTIDRDALTRLIGPARTGTLLAAVAASRAMPAASLLHGLNIPKVGQGVAAAIGRAFPRLADLRGLTAEDIGKATGLGPVVCGSVATWFADPANQDLLRQLGRHGVECVEGRQHPEKQPPRQGQQQQQQQQQQAKKQARGGKAASGGAEASAQAAAAVVEAGAAGQEGAAAGLQLRGVAGLRVCITGTIKAPDGSKLPRSQMQSLLESSGAEVHDRVRPTTDLLLAGEGTGANKTQDAARRGVRVVQAHDFWAEHLAGGGAGGGR